MEQNVHISEKPFRILSIDGGGLRGILVVEILKWIEENILGPDSNGNPKSITDSFDLIAGTSTGALIACALTVSDKNSQKRLLSLDDIRDVYQKNGSKIFPSSKTKIGNGYDWLQNKFNPKYSPKGLQDILTEKFTDKRILDCSKNIFIPAYNVARFKPVYFTSRLAKEAANKMQLNANKFNCKLTDICLATSAAPTYLPSHIIEYSDNQGYNETLNCIDGGVYLNNPAMAAFVEVVSNPLYYRGVPKINEKDVYILSIGTGKVAKNISAENGKNWGEVKWAKNVIEAAMLGNSQSVEEYLSSILPQRHLRINLDVDTNFSQLDDSSPDTFKYLTEDLFINQFVKNGSWAAQLLAFKNLANL